MVRRGYSSSRLFDTRLVSPRWTHSLFICVTSDAAFLFLAFLIIIFHFHLVKHIDKLRIYIPDKPFDILFINETRLDNSIHNDEIEISGYEITRKDRNRNGGGVAIHLRNNISYKKRNHLIYRDVEAICLEIHKPKSKPTLISTWYRPPDLDARLLDHYEKFLQKRDDENNELIITGDLNCNLLA